MTDSRVALGLDRLPWLSDEPVRAPSKPRAAPTVWPWLVGAVILVAGASYWFGMNSWTVSQPPVDRSRAGPPAATVRLPDAAPAQPQVQPTPMPVIDEPASAPRRVSATHSKTRSEPSGASVESAAKADEEAAPKVGVHKPQSSQVWPVRVVDGASGRLVRVGTFRTARQAKKGWWAIVRMNPTLKRLPALVVPVQSQRDGRVYYRLQMGTTSQAHSTVLCQRMRMIGQSCVVIDERRSAGR